MTIFDTIKADVENVLEKHRGEVEAVLGDAAAVADSPAAQVLGSMGHIPPEIFRDLGAVLGRLDAEFARLQATPAPDPTAPASAAVSSSSAAEPSSAASGPSEVVGEPSVLVVGPPVA